MGTWNVPKEMLEKHPGTPPCPWRWGVSGVESYFLIQASREEFAAEKSHRDVRLLALKQEAGDKLSGNSNMLEKAQMWISPLEPPEYSFWDSRHSANPFAILAFRTVR